MLPTDQRRFPARTLSLRNGRTVISRHLRTNDTAALTAFYGRVPLEDYRFYCPFPLTPENARKRTGQADDAGYACLVLTDEDDTRILGLASFQWVPEECSGTSVFGICLDRELQGTGAGKAIMEHLIEIGEAISPPRMRLTVQETNPRAVALYQKMGFAIVRQQTRDAFEEFPPEPEYVMERAMR